ncbi:ABC-type uncharacterized transport system, periplasmic component [Desulfosporosinus youngiae DSM 17734]|uniref:ABC-type uncharacterized transport system, periplasmic component n=2 Tax=Desulfosporosinus TaxID=79206 RepID=H5XY65_9FIRM|nr:ABC-type uncharacterized transport system, periplasmic component [Desulfosporosinus youngiae DSM 17734]
MGRIIYIIYILYLIGAGFYMSKVSIGDEKVIRIGVLSQNEGRLEKFEGLKDELKNLNYEEGKDVVYEVMTAPNDYTEMDQLAEKLVSKKFNVLVASGEGETRSLAKTVAKLNDPPPIIFMGTLSPIAIGLVENEVFPETNVTGLNNYHYELISKRLDLLKRLIPQVEEVAVLGDQRTIYFQDSQPGLSQTAQALNIRYKMYDITNEQDIPGIVDEISKNSHAILIMPGSFLETHTEEIASYALLKGVPVFGVYPSDIERGCIASYGTSYYNQGAQTAHMVHKIIIGYSPKSIPVETAEKLSFKVNLEVARKLGISLEEAYLGFADEVIGQGGYH